MPSVHFRVPPSQLSVAKAVGIVGAGDAIVDCPLHPGDLLSFPEAPAVFWRVTRRALAARKPPAQSEWTVWLEQADNPDL